MKSRESLIRLKRFQTDEKRQQVAAIEAMIADFERMASDLDNQIQVEQERTGISDVAHFAYPTFAKAAIQRRDNLVASANELRGKLEDAQDDLAEAVEELKKIELIEEREADRERDRDKAKDQADMDEAGIAMHRRG